MVKSSHPPPSRLSLPQVVTTLKTLAQTAINDLLTELLETRHLYQSVIVPLDAHIASLAEKTHEQTIREGKYLVLDWLKRPWIFRHFDPSAGPPINSPLDTSPELLLRPARLVCPHCKIRQAHLPVTWSDDTDRATHQRMVIRTPAKATVQSLTLSQQCQGCHSHPTNFLIRRDGMRMRLEGRSPMELIELPAQIPSHEAEYYRDAVMAHNAGKTLGGLFFLRTFLEQFARRVVGVEGRVTGDEVMERYGDLLPIDLRDRMPSFKDLYGRVSEALHNARADADLFSKARADIEKHLDIRRVFDFRTTENRPSE